MKLAATLGALAIVAQLAIPGCSTTIDPNTVITAVESLCKFAPDLNTVNALIHANGALQTATAVAQAICAAVPPPPVTSLHKQGLAGDVQVGTISTPNGPVPVVGHYVQ